MGLIKQADEIDLLSPVIAELYTYYVFKSIRDSVKIGVMWSNVPVC